MQTLALAGPFDTISGLPVHVLVVHALVVLLPLCGLGAIVIAIIPAWSWRFGPLVWLGAAVCLGLCLVATESGEALARRVGLPAEHAQLGERVKYYAAALTVVTFVLWLLDRRTTQRRSLPVKILAGVVIVVGLAAIYGAFVAGESGSKAVWSTVISDTTPASQ